MRLLECFLGLWALIHAVDAAASKSSSGSKVTITLTATAEQTYVWVTYGAQPTQIVYHQTFTAYWSGIASPRSGSIGLGWLSGSVGQSRALPLQSVPDAANVYSSAFNASLQGPLKQDLDTNSIGVAQGASYATVVAIAGYTDWYGPSYSQNSEDSSGLSAPNVNFGELTIPVSGTLMPVITQSSSYTIKLTGTTVTVVYDGVAATTTAAAAAAATTTTTAAAAAAAAATTTSSTTTTVAEAAGAVTTSSTTTTAAAAAAAVTTTTTTVAGAGAVTTTTTSHSSSSTTVAAA